MKYFEIQDTPELKYAPRLQNWYGAFDVRDIGMESYPKLPERLLFIVEPSGQTVFTDFILLPFLLVSHKVMDVIKMYKERCYYRDVILLDQLSGRSEMYCLPVFDETDRLQILEKSGENEVHGEPSAKQKLPEVHVNKNIFWVRDFRKRHTVISLELAESLLRREVFGLGIREVTLFTKEEEKE